MAPTAFPELRRRYGPDTLFAFEVCRHRKAKAPALSTTLMLHMRRRRTHRSPPMRLRSSVNSGWQLAGWALPGKPAALLLGPEPAIATWINQDQLIDGQQPWNTLPLNSVQRTAIASGNGVKRTVGSLFVGDGSIVLKRARRQGLSTKIGQPRSPRRTCLVDALGLRLSLQSSNGTSRHFDGNQIGLFVFCFRNSH